MKEQIDIFDDLLIEFDEMGFVPTNFLPDHDSEYYAIDWRNRLINALEGYRKQSEAFSCGHEKGVEWVKLPCKVGDTLYVISQMKDKRILPFINEYEVTSIVIKRKSIVIYHEMDGYIKKFKQTDFGKTVFLTKGEAERALTENNVGSK